MEEWVSPKELSRLLKVSKTWPYKMAKKGRIPCYRLEGVVRFRQADVQAFFDRSKLEKK